MDRRPLKRLAALYRKRGVAAKIVAQLGSLMVTGKWPLKRLAGDRKRGVDFYPTMDFIHALVASANVFKKTHGYLPCLTAPSSFSEHLFVRKFFAPFPMP